MPVTVIEEFNDFAKIADAMTVEAGRIVNRTIHRIEARWKGSLSGPRSGRTYRKGRIGRRMSRRLEGLGLRTYQTEKGATMAIVGYRFHRASAPGEAPATDTGNLANSIYARMTGKTEGEVGSNAECAPTLELGGAHMAARPSLVPAVRAEWPEFIRAMKALGE